jgi:pyruvate/2-oxoglutarate dehydrogenase complex dihydrolipoamide acyltransferase (E2) component
MTTDVQFPVMSAEHQQTEGVVATWFVRDGESVAADQLLAEVQLDKVSAEVPAPQAGIVRLLVPEGAVVKQGQPIARLE